MDVAPETPPDVILYTAEERRIFRIQLGEETRCVDPLAVWRHLQAALPGDDLALVQEQRGHRDRELVYAAAGKAAAAACSAFGIPPLGPDGTGLTEAEALRLLDAFLAWEAGQKKATGPSPSTSPPTDTPPGSAG